jgi:hypothetical protein
MSRASLAVVCVLAGCAGPGAAVTAAGPEGDRALGAELEHDLAQGERQVADFFGAPFPRPPSLRVAAGRAAFTAALRTVFRQPDVESACWMVGVGTAAELVLLSPRRWADQACDHADAGEAAVRGVLTHELVHVYHSQVNASLEADSGVDLEPIGWFVEGLAVLASGQLDERHRGAAREALASGQGPSDLEQAWSGRYRYGVSGSLVAYIDATHGRAALVRLLSDDSEAAILGHLGTSEAALLAAWRAWVEGGAGH